MVDSLRAVAALAVVAVHVEVAVALAHHLPATSRDPLRVAMAHLGAGVPVFFAISGFVLYRPFLAGRRGHAPAVRLGDYARRRLLRILPGYWVALTLLSIAPGLPDVFTRDAWLRYGLLSQILPAPPHVDCAPLGLCGLAPAWSLSVELGFYVLLPAGVLALAAVGRRSGPAWVGAEITVLALVASASALLYVEGAGGATAELARSPLGLLSWFVSGMVLAALSVRRAERATGEADAASLRVRAWVGWTGAALAFAALCATVPLLPTGATAGERAATLVLSGACGVLMLLPAISVRDGGAIHRLLGSRPLRALGLVSYGIFLYHYPIVFGLARIGADGWLDLGTSFAARAVTLAATALPLTLLAATFSYRVVERPFLRLGRRRRSSGARSAGPLGADGGIRTPDRPLTRRALYP